MLTLDLTEISAVFSRDGISARYLLPGPFDVLHLGLDSQLAFRAHFASDTSHLSREDGELVYHIVDCVDQVQDFARHFDSNHLLGEVSASDSGLDWH